FALPEAEHDVEHHAFDQEEDREGRPEHHDEQVALLACDAAIGRERVLRAREDVAAAGEKDDRGEQEDEDERALDEDASTAHSFSLSRISRAPSARGAKQSSGVTGRGADSLPARREADRKST